MESFSKNLKICRKRLHVSQEIVAVNCKISYGTYRRYETGEREPSLSTFCAFADYFGVTLDQLAGRAPLPDEESKDNPQEKKDGR
ncbi:MAG: helix-turn-helix transcriptional regulator [Oscillibacter sp.]|nr:helix-turn-helix transcriptional regulator [Oscillibacter sp.]